MIGNKSSIYNAQSVYNQGGGKAQIVINGQVFETTTKQRGGLVFTDKNLDVPVYGVTSVYPNNSSVNKEVYGLLYKKSEIIAAAATFLYDGWRIPTGDDWNTFLDSDDNWHNWQSTDFSGGYDLYGFHGVCAGTYSDSSLQYNGFSENAFFVVDNGNANMRGDNFGSWNFRQLNIDNQWFVSVRFCKNA